MALGLTQTEFAHMGGFHPRTVLSVWGDRNGAPGASLKTLREFERLLAALRRLAPPAVLAARRKGAERGLGGTRPVDLIVSGQVDSIWRLLYARGRSDMS